MLKLKRNVSSPSKSSESAAGPQVETLRLENAQISDEETAELTPTISAGISSYAIHLTMIEEQVRRHRFLVQQRSLGPDKSLTAVISCADGCIADRYIVWRLPTRLAHVFSLMR